MIKEKNKAIMPQLGASTVENTEDDSLATKFRSQLRKGVLDLCILKLLEKRHMYTAEMIVQLSAANLIVVEGTLYPLLNRLKNDGMLTYIWEESPAGPPRKYYSITPTGRQHLNAMNRAWYELTVSIDWLSDHTAENSL